MASWAWEPVDPHVSGSSGDLAKMFKNEEVKRPGVLALDAPHADATLLAREVIQNSWDAAQSLRADLATEDNPPDFEIDFTFGEHTGPHRAAIVETLGLGELADRAAELDATRLGLGDAQFLPRLMAGRPIRTLDIVESGTCGMYGPWRGKESRLYLALLSLGFTQKDDGAGGSYGYGKAGLIRGSAIRTLLAYTCFREQADDPGVTRRLLGMTYWGTHELNGDSFSGFARLGGGEDGLDPLENEQADEVAASVGIDTRDPGVDAQLGTTFLLIEPTIDPLELLRAIERNWWPALSDPTFDAGVHDYDGNSHYPRPKSDPVLLSFMRAHEVATMPQDNVVATERPVTFNRWQGERDEPYRLGTLGLVADPEDWSYPAGTGGPHDEDVMQHRSLVALVRAPKMVVEYFDAGRAVPFVRGVFVADDDVDDLLRQTEPKAHDAWDPRPSSDDIDTDAPGTAKAILDRVRRSLNDFRRSLKPPTPDRRELRLPDLENLFKQVLAGEGTQSERPPSPDPRDVAIAVLEQHPELDPSDEGRIRLRARVGYRLADHHEADSAPVLLRITYKFVEDGRVGEECPLVVAAPPGFGEAEGVSGGFEGVLGRGQVVFEVTSAPYEPDWSGRLVASGDVRTGAT